LYLAYESWIAFTLVALMVAVAGRRYHLLGKKMGVRFQEMMAAENRQFESVTDLLDGFKEAKLWRERSQAIGDIYDELSDEGTESRIDTQNGAYQQFVFGQTAFYAMLALMVFVVPLYSDNFDGEITQATMAVLFLIGPIGVVIQSLTTLAGAEAAAAGMYRLDKILAGMEEETNGVDPFPAPFREVRMDQIRFTYGSLAGLDGADVNGIGPAPGARSDPAESAGDPEAPPELEAEPEPEPEPEEKPFAVGPINLTLRAGELVFLTGGNGSGKTTLIRLLTGLYRPDGGEIRVNGEPVSDMRRPDFRELTASVFSDVHLFPRLYGLSESGQERVRSLLPLFEMDAKVSFDGDRFSTIDLSQGQKKRLALIATLAEEKPILVLDEWAADQDPRFRKIFYRKILPALKEIGLCVIAVTHDDHYFDGADRRLHMDMGALEELPVPTKPGPPSILNGASSKSEAADKDGSAKPEEAH
ncbi:MAG: ATP-binding cassette domain-containing protein, partial [Rhodospirillaceae bacterium]